MTTKIITNEQHYNEVIMHVLKARHFVWIGTADIKDLHVNLNGRTQSFLVLLSMLVRKKVAVRLLHAKEPGINFRNSFDNNPVLWNSMERQLCPRVHFKQIIIDGKWAYMGSANLTGAGLGMKSKNRRNFETGLITNDSKFIEPLMQQFDKVWIGKYCKACGRKNYCSDPIL